VADLHPAIQSGAEGRQHRHYPVLAALALAYLDETLLPANVVGFEVHHLADAEACVPHQSKYGVVADFGGRAALEPREKDVRLGRSDPDR